MGGGWGCGGSPQKTHPVISSTPEQLFPQLRSWHTQMSKDTNRRTHRCMQNVLTSCPETSQTQTLVSPEMFQHKVNSMTSKESFHPSLSNIIRMVVCACGRVMILTAVSTKHLTTLLFSMFQCVHGLCNTQLLTVHSSL